MVAPLIGAALIGGSLGLGGSLFQGFMGSQGGMQGKSFTERMSRNRIRYAMEDMKAGGLNPILAAGGSFSGSAPSSTGIASNIPFNVGSAAAEMMGAAGKAIKVGPEEKLLGEQAGNQAAGARAHDALAAKEGATRQAIEANQPYLDAQAEFYRTPIGKAAVKTEAILRPLGAVGGLATGFLGGRLGRSSKGITAIRGGGKIRPNTSGKGFPSAMSRREKDAANLRRAVRLKRGRSHADKTPKHYTGRPK